MSTSAIAIATPHMIELRQHLLGTLADLRNRENPMEPDRARAVAQVASVLVDTAKVEVEYLRATGQERSGFLEEPPTVAFPLHQPASTPTANNPFPPPPPPTLPQGITAVRRHTLRDHE